VDYGEGPMVRCPETGKYRRTRLFVLTLAQSGIAARLLLWKSSSRVWAELHEHAFRRLGAVTRPWCSTICARVCAPEKSRPDQDRCRRAGRARGDVGGPGLDHPAPRARMDCGEAPVRGATRAVDQERVPRPGGAARGSPSTTVVREFVDHYHQERNHQGLANALVAPLRAEPANGNGVVGRSERLGACSTCTRGGVRDYSAGFRHNTVSSIGRDEFRMRNPTSRVQRRNPGASGGG
jgi:hypothetical protein